jgi:hypothetical protein
LSGLLHLGISGKSFPDPGHFIFIGLLVERWFVPLFLMDQVISRISLPSSYRSETTTPVLSRKGPGGGDLFPSSSVFVLVPATP